jgi:hypothetical protein
LSQHAVGRIHQLVGQRRYIAHDEATGVETTLQEFLANLGPVASEIRHFELAQPGPRGQGCEAGEADDLPGRREGARTRINKDVSLGVGGAKDTAAVEVVAGAPIPEVVEVEARSLHGGRVARFHPSKLVRYPQLPGS